MDKALIIYPETEAEFWQSAKEDAVMVIRETLKKQKDCRLGLAGGSTPKHLYELLAEEALPWERIKIILIDERYVPSDHPESNLRMIRETLLKKIPLPPENLIAFDTVLPKEIAAAEMSRKLIGLTHERNPLFDLLILGAGADGHIASLFEGEACMDCREYAYPSCAKGYPVEDRLTLCLMALENSNRALLLLKGPEKLAVVQSLEGGSDALKLTALHHLIEKMTVKVLAFLS